MSEDILHDVSGYRLSPVRGVLNGYRRLCVKGECYPGLVPAENESVKGVVYQDVNDEAWERLDRFEGAMYQRGPVRVELDGGTTVTAATYIVRPDYMHLLDNADWDFEQFLQQDKLRFQNRINEV